MGWRLAALAALLGAGGCYASHAGTSAPADAGRRTDAGRVADAGRTDAAARRDASGRLDAGPPRDAARPSCELVVLDQRALSSVGDGCGTFLAPRAVARGPGSFDALLTEMRFCDDRPGEVRQERFEVRGDRLVAQSVVAPTIARSAGTEGAFADSVDALCGGLWLTTTDGAGRRAERQVEPDPVSEPGCPRARRCSAVAPFGDGSWAVGWRVFECDEARFEVGRYGRDLERIGELVPTPEPGLELSSMTRGVAWVGPPRPEGRALLTRWSDANEAPRFGGVLASGQDVALTPWFIPGFAALVVARDAGARTEVEVVLVDEAGVERRRYGYDAFLAPHENFGGPVVTAALADFGLVISVTVHWLGGAARTSTIVFAVGPDGERLGPGHRIDDELFGEGGDLAASDGHALFVRRASEQAEALLFACR